MHKDKVANKRSTKKSQKNDKPNNDIITGKEDISIGNYTREIKDEEDFTSIEIITQIAGEISVNYTENKGILKIETHIHKKEKGVN